MPGISSTSSRIAGTALVTVWLATLAAGLFALSLADLNQRDDGAPPAPYLDRLLGHRVFLALVVLAPLAAVVLWYGPPGRSRAVRALSLALVPIAVVTWVLGAVLVL